MPSEGKTTTVCNLAISLAQTGAKVLLIEADLRRPRVAQYLGLDGSVGLTSVLSERNSIRMIVCRHEGGAGFMAVADGRLRNRAGVAIVSRGPGLANAMVSLHSAFHDATPMVMLVGQVERRDFGRGALQEQNYSKLLSDITKSVIEVNEPEQASEAIARAFHLAETGTPGPVAVILPEDIFDESTDAELNLPRPRVLAGPRTEDLEKLADMLAKAERPLILAGGALLAEEEVRRQAAQADGSDQDPHHVGGLVEGQPQAADDHQRRGEEQQPQPGVDPELLHPTRVVRCAGRPEFSWSPRHHRPRAAYSCRCVEVRAAAGGRRGGFLLRGAVPARGVPSTAAPRGHLRAPLRPR